MKKFANSWWVIQELCSRVISQDNEGIIPVATQEGVAYVTQKNTMEMLVAIYWCFHAVYSLDFLKQNL